MDGDSSVTEYSGTFARRAVVGIGAFVAATALMGFGAGAATADDMLPQPSQPSSGPYEDGNIRVPAVQGEVRASGSGQANAQGEVRGGNRAVPGTTAWNFSGAGGDISACVYDSPYCSTWLGPHTDPNNP